MSRAEERSSVAVILFDAEGTPSQPEGNGLRRFQARGETVVKGLDSPRFLLLRELAAGEAEPVLPEGGRLRFQHVYREIAREVTPSGPPTGSAVLIVMLDVEPEHQRQMEEGYAAHLGGRLRFPGFLSARFMKAAEGASPQYLALYELSDPAAPTSKEYLSQTPDATSALLRDHGRLLVRQVYVEA